VVGMIVVNADALRTRLEEIKSRTKSCIDISARLVHKSVSHLQKSRHNLHIVNRSQELLDKFLKTRESQSLFRELPDNAGVADECTVAVHCETRAAHMMCDHCDGILLNNKAYRVRTEDDGLLLLDMTVCHACNLEAQNLGLKTVQVQKTTACFAA
jgi:RNase P subunit RPR2